eukprot:m51a1_g1571 hypothetical protein (294) ;mRNA; r:70350-71389
MEGGPEDVYADAMADALGKAVGEALDDAVVDAQNYGIDVAAHAEAEERREKEQLERWRSGPVEGLRVRRGRSWRWGDQDGGAGPASLGTVTRRVPVATKDAGCLVEVEWDATLHRNVYRCGFMGSLDLDIVDGDAASAATTAPRASDVIWRAVVELRDAVKDGAVAAGVALQRPEGIQGLYQAVLDLERAIAPEAHPRSWLTQGRRRQWESQLRAASVSNVRHLAGLVLALEAHISPTFLKPDFAEEEWKARTAALGADVIGLRDMWQSTAPGPKKPWGPPIFKSLTNLDEIC